MRHEDRDSQGIQPQDSEDARGVRCGSSSVDEVLDFIVRAGTALPNIGNDGSDKSVLEVAEIWGDTVLDVQHFGPAVRPVRVGASTGHRWRLLGMPIAWVSPAFAKMAWLMAPTLSEAREERRNDFYVPPGDLPLDDFALFERVDGDVVFNWSDRWAGFVQTGDTRCSLADLIASGTARKVRAGQYQLAIDEDTQVVANLGTVVFFGQRVAAPKRVQTKVLDSLDYPFLGAVSFMSFLLALIGLVYVSAGPPQATDVVEVPDRFVEIMLAQPQPTPAPPERPQEAQPDAGKGAKAKGKEGKVGKREAKADKAKGKKVAMKRQRLDKKIAESAGVLGALTNGADLDGVFASSVLDASLAGSIGSLTGAKGTQIGTNGLSSRGSGLGGNGTVDDIGSLGTQGVGGGQQGYGNQSGYHGDKTEGGLGRIGGDPIILGALDKALVDAVVKRHMNQIRHCYQRELTRQPTLAGKVSVKFVIAKDGTVSKAYTKTSTMDNRTVESCINGRFMRFQFPAPKGGGIVMVSYPFIFAPG